MYFVQFWSLKSWYVWSIVCPWFCTDLYLSYISEWSAMGTTNTSDSKGLVTCIVYMCILVIMHDYRSFYPCVVLILVGYQMIFSATEDPFELRLIENSRWQPLRTRPLILHVYMSPYFLYHALSICILQQSVITDWITLVFTVVQSNLHSILLTLKFCYLQYH